MNKIKITLMSLFFGILAFPFYVYASQFCPTSVFLQYGQFTAPAGWHVTRNEIDTSDPTVVRNPHLEFLFYTASYNSQGSEINSGSKIARKASAYNLKVPNNNRISCYYDYLSNDKTQNISAIEITTDQDGFSTPIVSGTKWKKLSEDSAVCGFPLGDAGISDCPWG